MNSGGRTRWPGNRPIRAVEPSKKVWLHTEGNSYVSHMADQLFVFIYRSANITCISTATKGITVETRNPSLTPIIDYAEKTKQT